MCGNPQLGRLAPELLLCQSHHATLVVGLHRIEEIRTRPAHVKLRNDPMTPQCDGEPVGITAAMPRTQEDGRRFTPQLELEGRTRPQPWICPSQCHHYAGGSTRELGRLVEVWRRMLERTKRRRQAFLEPQRVGTIRIIVEMPPEQLVSGLAIPRDRLVVLLMNLEPQDETLAGDRRLLAGLEQRRADAAPCKLRHDRERIESGDDAAF